MVQDLADWLKPRCPNCGRPTPCHMAYCTILKDQLERPSLRPTARKARRQ